MSNNSTNDLRVKNENIKENCTFRLAKTNQGTAKGKVFSVKNRGHGLKQLATKGIKRKTAVTAITFNFGGREIV